jgi:hypothetical protein
MDKYRGSVEMSRKNNFRIYVKRKQTDSIISLLRKQRLAKIIRSRTAGQGDNSIPPDSNSIVGKLVVPPYYLILFICQQVILVIKFNTC